MLKITARVRAAADYGEAITFAVGYSFSKQVVFNDNKWHDVTIYAGSVSSYSKLKTPMSVVAGASSLPSVKESKFSSITTVTLSSWPDAGTAKANAERSIAIMSHEANKNHRKI